MSGNKMSRWLMRNFIILTAAPLILTVVAIARISREQIVWTADTMRKTNQSLVGNTTLDFQEVGDKAIRRSAAQAGNTSLATVTKVTHHITQIQSNSFGKAAQEISHVSAEALSVGLHQSLRIQSELQESSQKQQAHLLASSVKDMQEHAGEPTKLAMLTLNEEIVQEKAQALADRLQDRLRSAPYFLAFTSQMLDMGKEYSTDRKVILDALVRRIPQFHTVAVLDKNGQEITKCAADQLIFSSDLKNRVNTVWFQQAYHGKQYIAISNKISTDRGPLLRVAVPITAFAGKTVGVLSATYSLDDTWDAIAETRIGKSGFALVKDSNGHALVDPHPIPKNAVTASVTLPSLGWTVVAVTPIQEAMQPIVALHKVIENSALREQLMTEKVAKSQGKNAADQLAVQLKQIAQKSKIQMQRKVRETLSGMHSSVLRQVSEQRKKLSSELMLQGAISAAETSNEMEVDASSASSQMEQKLKPVASLALSRADHRLTYMAILITILSCVATAIGAVITANRIVRPVVKLSNAAGAIARGELDNRVEEIGPDEIADLAKAFNMMAASLQKSQGELHETEGQLVQSAKLASLGTLSAGVAHELNQPLAIIRGLSQQLMQDKTLDADTLEDLSIIEGQTGRMVKIVKHLRTFCRAGQAEFDIVDINQTLQDCFILIGAQLKSHNVEADLQLCEETANVMGDANELEQVFINLITNSRDAVEGRENAMISIRSWIEQGKVFLEFHDNGSGIPEDKINRIFDPFFTTKAPGKGTGLGLSISHSILKRHNANISALNKDGATFTITIPLYVEEACDEKMAA